VVDSALLPRGARIAPAGIIARVSFEGEAGRRLAEVYRRVTLAGQVATVSDYLLDYWQPVWKPSHFATLVKLQRIARRYPPGADLPLTLPEIAEETRQSVDAVRDFRAWLAGDPPRDDADRLAWLSLRAYIPRFEPAGSGGRGRPVYRWSVLLDDVPHPAHWWLFRDAAPLAAGPAGQQCALLFSEEVPHAWRRAAFSHPLERSPGEFGAFSHPLAGECVAFSDPLLNQPAWKGSEKATLCSHDMSCLSVCQTDMGEASKRNPEPGEWGHSTVADLVAIGYSVPQARRFLKTPRIARRAAHWRAWLANLKAAGETITNPPGLVRKHVEGRCGCVDPDCDEPFASEAYRKRRERDAEVLAGLRGAAPAEAPRAAMPAGGLASLPELVPYLDRLRAAVGPELAGFLAEAAAVALEQGVLVLAVPTNSAREWLARKLPAVVKALPDFPPVRVETRRGPHETVSNAATGTGTAGAGAPGAVV
jgi:hypothetical protein